MSKRLRYGCGPAAGQYVLRKLKGFIYPQEDIAFYMQTDPVSKATYPTHFIKAMRHYGLTVRKCCPMTIQQFIGQVNDPDNIVVTAFFNHWYTAMKIERDVVTFFCSIDGTLTMTLDEFESSWVDKTSQNRPVVNLGIVCRKGR